jgi:DhnA family fructose-bisphosphate aldolase class Ia
VSFGKERRMRRIMGESGSTYVLPLDDGLISGPREGLNDPGMLVRLAVEAGAACVLGYPGLLRACTAELREAGFIQNLTASTTLAHHTEKVLLGSVEDAVRNGADGVAVHVNLSADGESRMLSNLGAIAEECRKLDFPLFVLAYPRRSGENGDDNYTCLRESSPDEYTTLVAHCARVAVEAGADIIKVPYPGSAESVEQVVSAALGVPVVVAGGKPMEDEGAIAAAVESVKAGAAGVAYGRQTFMRPLDDIPRFVINVLDGMRLAEASKRGASLAASG